MWRSLKVMAVGIAVAATAVDRTSAGGLVAGCLEATLAEDTIAAAISEEEGWAV